MNKKISMFQINNFKDEKFRDTIKKNYCRLRQKSSNQLGEYLTNQPQNQYQNKIQKAEKNKEITKKIKEINTINSKYKNYNQTKIYIKRSIKEDKQINMKKKKTEENNNCNLPLKQRIFLKLKEERNEKMKNNEEKNHINHNYINHNFTKETSFKNFLTNHKRYINSMDFKNVIYKNSNNNEYIEHKNRDLSNTINNDIINNNELRNIKINFDKNFINNRNHKNLSSHGNKTIIDIKNSGSKINNFDKTSIFLTKNKTDLNDEKTEIIDFSKSYLTNQINTFSFDNDQLSENLHINKRKNHEINNNNEMFFSKKRESYFSKRMKCIMDKNEEEKNKYINDDQLDKSIILNKTYGKPANNFSFFNDKLASNKLSQININNNKFISVKSLNFHKSKSRKDLLNTEENRIKNTIDYKIVNNTKKNIQVKRRIIYLETEKPKLFSRSILFKNLMINTDYNTKNKSNKKIIDKNITKLKNISEISESKEELINSNNNFKKKINIDYINNDNYNSPNCLTSRNNKIFFSELLKNDKDKQHLKTKEKVIQKKELCNLDYIIKMFIETIQLKNSIEIYSLFSILLVNFNNKYIVLYDQKIFLKDVLPFIDCYKYLSIFITPLIFFYKDENIYKINCSEVKKIFENLIIICIEKIGQKAFKYKRIVSFMDEHKTSKKYNLMKDCCLELIKVVFKNYKEYTPLKKVTEQLLDLSHTESIEKVIYIINNIILYCFNHKQKNSFYLLSNLNGTYTYKKNKSSNKDINNKTIIAPSVPYIKVSMKKKFCLVLDIDETIVHTLNLPFDNYFLLRPGVINFLEEVSQLYEIIIFTSSPKSYADSILDKIDIDNKFISHRLYKEHVIFEKGKSVKKLNMIGRDLSKIIFVDNMKCNAKYNLKNFYLISTWIQDINDQELIKLKTKLKYIATNSKFKDDITKGLELVI